MKKFSKKRIEIIAWRWFMILFCLAFWTGVYLIVK